MIGRRHFIPAVLTVVSVVGLHLMELVPEETIYLTVPMFVGMGIVFQYDHQNHGVPHATFAMLVSGVIGGAVLFVLLALHDPAIIDETVAFVTEEGWREHLPGWSD